MELLVLLYVVLVIGFMKPDVILIALGFVVLPVLALVELLTERNRETVRSSKNPTVR